MTRNELRQLIREVIQELEVDSEIDQMSGGSPHGRYAQQPGATPFDAPGDEAINENPLDKSQE